jgi:hypothetical protein
MSVEENFIFFLLSSDLDLSPATSKSKQGWKGIKRVFLKSVLYEFAYFIGFNVHLLQIQIYYCRYKSVVVN